MRTHRTITIALLVALAGVGVGGATAVAPPDDGVSPSAASAAGPAGDAVEVAPPPDPEEDVLGWENGVWHNESIEANASDGLDAAELERVVDRSMARIEQVRRLEFQGDVPVEIITREEYAEQAGGTSATTKEKLHYDAKWEATFMVNESASAFEALRSNRAASVLGYYSPSGDRIVVVSPGNTSGSAVGLDEMTLAHELVHAIQDQQFGLGDYFGNTTETNNALSGLVEGDARYTETLYQRRCDSGAWDCLEQSSGGGGSAVDLHVGLYIVSYVPYSEGAEFVRSVQRDRGWAGVNALYEDPPASTEQLIHHDRYPGDEPTDVRLEDTSSGDWHVLDLPGPTDHASFGEAGIFSMMWYPSYVASQRAGARRTVVVPYDRFFEPEGEATIGPYNYSHEVAAGWDGDRLVPYVKGGASGDAPTGYVWKIEWDTEADAREFVDAYGRLLNHHGAESVGERTWRIPEGTEFADAYHVVVEGTTVTIVNAPSVEELSGVRAGVTVRTPTPSPTPTPTPTDAPTSTPTGEAPTAETTATDDASDGTATRSPTSTGTSSPGFGPVAGLVALVAAVVLALRRD